MCKCVKETYTRLKERQRTREDEEKKGQGRERDTIDVKNRTKIMILAQLLAKLITSGRRPSRVLIVSGPERLGTCTVK